MNALLPHAARETDSDTQLLDLVTFKWLMAGIGWRVDLPRLQKDADYARVCAQRGLESGQALLGERAAELLAALPSRSRAMFTLSNDVRI
ncbi:hypothetical protein [Ramlibacter sp. WS9]|uniref:hypothetical protein n=1 Tax=Ramlibacter sp. WS9 TaxID=1882741 RepID=UPI001142F068|nr:hypothetical protein [Ramlibacter sp. WS9]ROZ66091.1 hypothetical protein EEB15_27525 [Ramlibacter sp. WS9]